MTTEHVAVDFQAGGIAEVQRAYAGMEATLLRIEKASIASAQREERARIAAARRTAQQVTQIASRGIRQDHADRKRREDEFNASVLASARKHAHDRLRLMKEAQRAETEAHKRELAAREAAEKASAARRKQFWSSVAGTAVGAVRGTMGTLASYGGMALGMAGGVSIASAANKAMHAESQSVSLANSMYNPNDDDQKRWLASKGMKRFDSNQLLSFTKKAAVSSNLDKSELMSGFQSYIAKSSDWKAMVDPESQDTLLQLARLAKATDTNFADVMNTAGSLKSQNKGLTSKQMMAQMYAIVGQGKAGAIEMNEVAKYGSTITAGASAYAGDQGENQRKLLGLVQVSARAAASGADAATGVARFGGDVAKHAKENEKNLKAEKFKVTDDRGKLLASSDILAEYFRVTKGDVTKMGEGKGNLGLGMESIKLARGASGTYESAISAAKQGNVDADIAKKLGLTGKKSFSEKEINLIGAEAVRKDVKGLEVAGYKKSDIDEDLRLKMATTQERFTKAMTAISEKIEVKVVPFLEKLAVALEKNGPAIEKFIDAMSKLAEWALANPFKATGAILAAKIGESLAAAGIQKAAEKALAGSLGQAGLVIGTAYMTAQLGMFTIDKMAEDLNKDRNSSLAFSNQAFAEAKALQSKFAEGKGTAEDRARLNSLISQSRTQVEYERENVHNKSMLEKIADYSGVSAAASIAEGDWTGNSHSQAYDKDRRDRLDQNQQALQELTKAARLAAIALEKTGKAGGPSDPNSPARVGPMTSPARMGTGN